MIRVANRALAIGVIALLAACGPKSTPPPPPPPPPQVVIPQRPYPPNGASPNFAVPHKLADGLYYSVNRNISPAQATWNLRSALNVGALNCHQPQHAGILPAYREFLRSHSRTLTATNNQVDKEWRGKYGSRFIPAREKYMTEVYNHFALPPTLTDFCDATLAVTRDLVGVRSADLNQFAARSLPNIEIVFDDFYRRYELYRTNLAAWEARYGGQPGSGGPVAASDRAQ